MVYRKRSCGALNTTIYGQTSCHVGSLIISKEIEDFTLQNAFLTFAIIAHL